jgi:hypothetical protein
MNTNTSFSMAEKFDSVGDEVLFIRIQTMDKL